MVINQGDIFWVDFKAPDGSEPGYRHPHVVIQNNLFNRSRINTVVVCTLTSNLKRANSPGNVSKHVEPDSFETLCHVNQGFHMMLHFINFLGHCSHLVSPYFIKDPLSRKHVAEGVSDIVNKPFPRDISSGFGVEPGQGPEEADWPSSSCGFCQQTES